MVFKALKKSSDYQILTLCIRFNIIILDCTESVSLVGKKQKSQFGHSVIIDIV